MESIHSARPAEAGPLISVANRSLRRPIMEAHRNRRPERRLGSCRSGRPVGSAMLRAIYCRRQAESCLRLSETCQDPLTAKQLLVIAAEYFPEGNGPRGGPCRG